MDKKNKIIVKLFEEFKNDNTIAKTRLVEALNHLIDNKSSKTFGKANYGNAMVIHIDNYQIYYTTNYHELSQDDTVFNLEIEIMYEYSTYNETFTIKLEMERKGGGLIFAQTQTNPAEYANLKFNILEITDYSYTKEFVDEHDASIYYDGLIIESDVIIVVNKFIDEFINDFIQ